MRLRNYVIYAIENDFTIDIRVYEKDAVTRVCTMNDRSYVTAARETGWSRGRKRSTREPYRKKEN